MGMIRDDNQQLSKNHNKGICFIEVGLSNLAFQMIWIDHPKYFKLLFLEIRSDAGFQCWNWLPPSPLQQHHLTTRAQFFSPQKN